MNRARLSEPAMSLAILAGTPAALAASFTTYRPVDPEPGHVVTLYGVSGDGPTAESGMQLLGGLGGDGFIESRPTAVSADDSAIVGSSILSRHVAIPFIHTREGGMRPLLDADGRSNVWGSANDISADGSVVVGETYIGLDSGDAFIWDADHGVRRLKSVLESLGVDLTGWRLNTASSILADGRTIFGHATDPTGHGVRYLAVIPEPATILLLGLGLAAIGFGRR